ncbi:hypothetical protein [Sulfurimonas sp.]
MQKTALCFLPNISTCQTFPHAKHFHMPNISTCQTFPHAKHFHMPNISTCQTFPHFRRALKEK